LQTSHKQYFNSGVMLINIRKWRNKQKQLLSAIKSGRFIKLGDQNIINFLFDNIKADISCAGFIYPRWFVIAEPPGFITKNKFIIHTILPKLWGKWTDKHFLYLLFSKQIYLFPLFFQWRSIYRTVEKNSKNI
jgi:lipopolysaccharide biosynthesis glycosyltransferase